MTMSRSMIGLRIFRIFIVTNSLIRMLSPQHGTFAMVSKHYHRNKKKFHEATAHSRYFTMHDELPSLETIGESKIRQLSSSRLHSPRSPFDNQTEQLILPYTQSDADAIPVTYTNNPRTVYGWFCDNLPLDGCTIGFDVEFVPDLPWIYGSFQGPATVQLATPESSLVVHLVRPSGRRSKACAPILKAVLCDELFVKAGCALDDDLLALYELWGGLDARSRLDLGGIGAEPSSSSVTSSTTSSITHQRRGLKTLSRSILGVNLPKSKSQALSDWSVVPLTQRQIAYSARDAWAGAAVVDRLAKHDPETFNNENLVRFLAQSETPLSTLVQRKRRRDRAKSDLGRLLRPYSSGARTSHSKNIRIEKRHLPTTVQAKVNRLRNEIKNRRMDHPIVFDVDRLGFNFDYDRQDAYHQPSNKFRAPRP